jgi:hypothetical protein
MSPHIKISYDNASGSGYKNQHTNVKIKITSNMCPISLDKASSHQTISASKPSNDVSFFQS